jgi:succinate dehydrogenase hydrophobic anchor subunit
MSPISKKLLGLLHAIPAILLVTFINVFICFTTAGVILIQLLAAGYNKYLSLGVALLVAIGCHAWIVYNHKLRDYIKSKEQEYKK